MIFKVWQLFRNPITEFPYFEAQIRDIQTILLHELFILFIELDFGIDKLF